MKEITQTEEGGFMFPLHIPLSHCILSCCLFDRLRFFFFSFYESGGVIFIFTLEACFTAFLANPIG